MPKQTITWTVLPAGVNTALTAVRFSVFVAPRLVPDGATGHLLPDFPDWVDWPASIGKAVFSLQFPDIVNSGTGQPLVAVADMVSKPDSKRWAALFPGDAPVQGHAFTGFDRRRIRSYPVRHIQDFLADRYGRSGARFPEQFPTLDTLTQPGEFGAIGFEFDSEKDGEGYQRKKQVRETLEGLFAPDSPDPALWAVPFRPADATTPDGIALSFLQLERFHRRREDVIIGDLPPVKPPDLDFHQVVAMTREYYRLQRLLGLVLDFECADPAVVKLVTSGPATTRVRLVTNFAPALGTASKVNVTPATRCRIGKDGFGYSFTAQPQDAAASDVLRGLLRVGDADRFVVVQVDPDNAALAARQFANNLTRSRQEIGGAVVKRSSTSPDTYALPALHSAGLSVGRLSRAARLATNVDRARVLNDTAFTAADDKRTDNVDLYADDLLRGYRWDVYDQGADKWFSLMWRNGQYVFVRQGDPEPVEEEAAALIAATTSGQDKDTDLYLQESMVHWAGWSLAVDRPGKALTGDNGLNDGDGGADETFAFRGEFGPRELPRLRFGRTYQLRARAVDLAGNSLTAQEAAAINDQTLVTSTQIYRRFDPVPAPEVLLRTPPGEAESTDVAAIRAATASDTNAGTADRHILPPRTSVQLAELHSKLDSAAAGHPVNPAWWKELANRDDAVLETESFAHPLPAPEEQHWYYDTDQVPIPYLPEVLAKRVLIRGLPGSTTSTTISLQKPTDWPASTGFRLRLQQGTQGWTWNEAQRLLTVTLRPGDAYQLMLSAQFDAGDLDLMGVWPWIQESAAAWNQAHPGDPVDITAVGNAIVDGKHPMFTPSRTLTLVHAVRTPLALADISAVVANRPVDAQHPMGVPGSTYAVVGPALTVSRKSTGMVEFLAGWTMPVDDGPGAATDPVTPKQFQDSALTVRMEHEYGPAPITETVKFVRRHEFGDTKYRKVQYQALATTRYAEYFRERKEITFSSDTYSLGVLIEPAMLSIEDIQTGEKFTPARAGETDPATAGGDYVITNALTGTFQRTLGGTLTAPRELRVSFVRQSIRTLSGVRELDIPSTARPAAAKISHVVPIFRWETRSDGASVRHGGGLRVYLERPWWSSGDGEKLGVLVWPDVNQDVPDYLHRYVTMWGSDPTVGTATVPDDVLPQSFPLATAQATGLTVPELPSTPLSVAGHDVGYDAERGLWYCDIRVTRQDNTELDGYFPFVRLALARYQPHSIAGCHLSSVATADFMQLAPDRTVSVTGSGGTRQIYVLGPGASITGSGKLNQIRITVERQLPEVTDPDLKWQPAGGNYAATFTDPAVSGNQLAWRGSVSVPTAAGTGPLRLVIEEFEVHDSGFAGQTGARLVYTDTVALP